MVITSDSVIGYALMLMYDCAYWNKGNSDTVDAQFCIHEGRKVNGKLQWADSAGEGTVRSREKETRELDKSTESELIIFSNVIVIKS